MTGMAKIPGRVDCFVVDDDPQWRTFVSNVMASMELTPHRIVNRVQLEQELTKFTPAVIVLDLSLGDSDAIEVIRGLKASHYVGAVLLMSGHDDQVMQSVRTVGMRHGLNMLEPLSKPFRVAELTKSLTAAISRSQDLHVGTPLETALKHGWLEIWYQPKINIRTNTLWGAEALSRINHPEKGVLGPEEFLPAPGDPLHHALADFVVRRALFDWTIIAEAGMNKKLAVNIPASVLQDASFVRSLWHHLPKTKNFPGLIAEITEDEAIHDPDLAPEVAVQLQLYGVEVAIDDFGAGFSGIARLKQLPFTELKLDRKFVNGCANNDDNRAMCKAVHELAKRFKVTAVAEGVDNTDDLRVLKEIGFPVAQGFLFSKPMPVDRFVTLIQSRRRAG